MTKQRGITLVELLVVIVIVAGITAVVIGLINYSLKTEQQVSAQNDVQREARFIMEYMTEKMRDKAEWSEDPDTGLWILERSGTVFLTYDRSTRTITMGSGGKVLSSSATLSLIKSEEDPGKVGVSLEISKLNQTIKLESTIYSRSRF